MKLTTQSSPVEVQGGNNTGSFSIAMNGKAFRVLSDTLYQNKAGSIVHYPGIKRKKEISFSVSKYGYNKAKQLAIEARANMLQDARKDGITYSDRHGKPAESVLE